ncbi:hypothetical protein BC826DRAFT_1105763 [Russula brevipes]|nr:hypothetical protein BC826DRAFT_1105763 [Russula brevipes]
MGKLRGDRGGVGGGRGTANAVLQTLQPTVRMVGQVVLTPGDAFVRAHTPLWTHPLLIPSYFVVASIVVLVFQAVSLWGPLKKLRARISVAAEDVDAAGESSASSTRTSLVSAVKDHVERSGGSIVFLFQFSRLILVLTLLGLSIFSFVREEGQHSVGSGIDLLGKHWGKKRKHRHKHHNDGSLLEREWLDLSLCLVYLYAAFLALLTLTARRTRASVASFHLSSLLVVTFSVYAYRDIWPLLTYTLLPADAQEGALLWAKIGLLFVAGIVVPLTVPRQYDPIDPKARSSSDPQTAINPEQTASVLSMALYTFLDHIVFLTNRVPHLSHDMLPPLADYDYTKYLVRRSFKHLDTFSGSPKRYLFWGFLTTFRKEYFQMAILIVVQVVATLMAPVGMNQLLRYLESHGEGAVVRPWVWIAYLFLGPAVRTIAFQCYIFIATGTLVRITAIVTQLVFEHALRIRVKAETSSSPRSTPAVTPETRSEATTPDNLSIVGDTTASETEGASGDENVPPTTPSSIKGKQKDSPATPAPGDDSEDLGMSMSSNLVGKMNNLVSTDLENLVDGRDFLLITLHLPLQLALCVWFLYSILGWSAFVGMAVMVALFPVPGVIAQKIQKVQKETLKRTDARVQTATETMGMLRMIKLFGWEPKIAERLGEKRDHELQYIKTRQILNLINGNINYVIPVITMVVTYVTYTAIMGQALTPSTVFSSMAVFDLLRDQLHSIFWMIPMFTQAKVSLDRVDDFLRNTELLDEYADVEKGSERVMLTDASHFDRDVIGFQNASFTWSNDDLNDGTFTPSGRKFTLRVDGELLFKRGCFNLIIGPTGSGKTSLLMALLGEMHFIPMTPDAWYHLPRSGGVSYAAQESWVQNETIRDNILFGAPYDEERYKKVIYQCGLLRDLSLFDAGDKTEVGEKGLTLSGGQKARITLARAVYSSAEILILDDVLAALDVHTARWIVDKCFGGDLILGRTVLLVTHNVAMASSLADYVVSLGLDGRVACHGSVSDAVTNDKKLAAELVKGVRAINDGEKKIDQEEPDAVAKQADGKLIVAEEIAEGHVSWDAFKLFLGGLGGSHVLLFWIVFIGALLLCDALLAVQTWFMGYWAEQYDLYPPETISVTFYLTVYGLILLCAMIFYTTGAGVYVFGTLRASRTIHHKLIEAILGTTLRWLDITPTSRVITRVTQDIRALDGPISNTFTWFIEISATMLIKFIAVVYVTPVFIIPGTVVAVLGGWLGQVYMKAQIAIKREMSNAKAPVLGHFGAAVAGLPSIRAYGAQLAFREESYKRIDKYSRAGRSFYNMNSLRIDFLGGLFAASLAAYLIYMPNKHALPSDTGFSLTMAIGFSAMILWWVRIFNDFEVNSNSLERMHSYINIEQEPKPSKQGIPPAYWPASGDLKVEKLSARYSLDGPKVLHDISFHIKSGERVGVVGRTGSGKSSLTLSLLRCIFTEGNVYYDGKLTSSINLDALRSSITIIPKHGTLRENLDPFSQYDDATLNGALRASGLFSLQSDDDEGRLMLDSQIASGGGNLSVGQRQILALARAIVRGSKLLILDEATSAIDYKTDTIIQTSLRNELKGDVTLITVAHRLQTIIDADKVVEFDKPSELLKNENGRFRSLVDESGDKDLLYATANQAGMATNASE